MAEKSDEVDKEGRRLSPESLFLYCKIVTSAFGYLELKEGNLAKVIMENVKYLGLPNDIPVAVLCVLGPPSSGKSFFTNLLIQYYKTGGDGGWLEKLIKKVKNGEQPEMAGFSWDSVKGSSPSIFEPSRATDLTTSGVYLWPQPFLMKHAGDKDLLVWILHLCRGVDKEDKDLQTLERFLLLACSRVTEIDVGNNDFRILKETSKLKAGQSVVTPENRKQICDSIVYIFRSETVGSKSKSVTDDEAKAELTDLLTKTKSKVDPSVLDNFKHINVAKLKEVDGALHDKNGCLNLKAEKNLSKSLKQIVGLITEESEVSPIRNGNGGEELHLDDFFQFLKSCVKTVNLLSPLKLPKLPAEEKPVNISTSSPAQHRKAPMDDAKNENPEQYKDNYCFLETSLDDTTDEKGYPNVPLSPDEETGADSDKEFVMVSKSDCDEGSMSKPVQPLTKATLTKKEFAIEEVQKTSSPIKTTEAATEVKKSIPKVERTGNRPGPTSSDREEQLQKMMSRISDSQSMLQPGFKLTCQNKFSPAKTSGYGSSASRMQSDVSTPTTRMISTQKEKHKVDISISQQETDYVAMDTTPAPDLATNEKDSGDVILREEMEKCKAPIVNQYEPMDIDNPEVDEAVKRMVGAEENRKRTGKAERTNLESSEEAQKKKEQLERDQKQKEDELLIGATANQAVLQMKSKLTPATENWLLNYFDGRNIEEMKNIYSQSLREVQAEGHKTVRVELRKALDRKIDSECKGHCSAYLTDLQNRMQTFYQQIKKKFDYHDCFTAIELDKLLTEGYPKVSQNLESSGPEKRHLLEIGCRIIWNHFQGENAKIIANEERLAKKLMPMVLGYYNEEMSRFLQEGVYAPNNLKEIHSNLIGRWVEGFKKSFRLTATGKTCENVENQLEDLKATLVQGFQKHLQQNNKNLERMQQQASKILQASKNSYIEKIEDVLNKNSEGLELRELTRRHEDIVNEAKILLRMEIKQKIRQDEPPEEHVKSLQAHMDNYWKVVLEANNKHLNKMKEREAEERKRQLEERKAEARQEQELRKAGKTLCERINESQTDSTSFQRNVIGGVQLPPLVFQLQSTRIRMGMCLAGKPRVLSNASGEQSTPLVVGLTNGGDLVYGSEAQANIPEEGDDPQDSGLLKHWWIADYIITSGSEPWTEDIPLNEDGEFHKITVEFLLGFFLKNLKEHVEADMEGTITTAVITVPCWLCSTQRIQVKDGGKLAGFEEVYLINEAAAAAFACASSEFRSSTVREIFIISENDGKIDASVYSCSLGKKVTLVGHCGSYCIEETTQNILKTAYELLRKGVKSIFWNDQDGEKSNDNEDKQHATTIQKIKKVVRQAQDAKYKSPEWSAAPNEVFVTSELEDLRPLLEQVGKENAGKICEINQDNGVLIGASLLSQNPNKIKDYARDKLMFEVLRKRGAERVQVIPKHEVLPTAIPRCVATTFPSWMKEADIFQSGLQGELIVGYLKLYRNVPAYHQLEVSLSLSNEAIIDIKSVSINSSYNRIKEPVPKNQYDWTTPNLTVEDLARLQLLLESLGTKQKENSKVLEAKQQLLQQCKEMKMQLETGTVFKIKSEVVKGMFVKRIEEAIKFAHHENSTLEQIQGQMESMAKWSSKYVK